MNNTDRVAQQIANMQVPAARVHACAACNQAAHDGECEAIRVETPHAAGWKCVRCGGWASQDPLPKRRYCSVCDGANATRELTAQVARLADLAELVQNGSVPNVETEEKSA